MLAKNLGFRIRALREARGWSLEKLAAESGKCSTTINKLEGGRAAEPSYRVIRDIVLALGVDFADVDDELAEYQARRSASATAEEALQLYQRDRRPLNGTCSRGGTTS